MLRATVDDRYLTVRTDGVVLDPPRLELCQAVARIPGVGDYPDLLEVPKSAWMLDNVRTLAWIGGAQLPDLSLPQSQTHLALAADLARPALAHQKKAAAHLLETSALLLGDEPGLGKTGSALLAARSVSRWRGDRPVVIIAPLFTRSTWQHEMRQMGIDEPLCVLSGRKMGADCWDPSARYYFIHYEILDAWWSRLAMRQPCLTICDEAHWIRNHKAKRSAAARVAIGVAPYKMLLTGTPMTSRPSELWSLLDAMQPRQWGSLSAFRVRYCGAFKDGYGLVDAQPTNVDELKARLAPLYLRRLVADVGVDLPELSRAVHQVQLTAAQRKAYDKAQHNVDLDALADALLRGNFSDGVLSAIHHLRQLTSEAKVTDTLNHIDNLLAQDEQVVCFTWRREMAELLARNVAGAHGVYVHGGVAPDARQNNIDTFQSGDKRLLAATFEALKEGVTLHAARHVVLHDLDWVPATILQAEKRVHRIGQRRACTSTWMVAPKSIDSIFARALLAKLSHLDTVFGERPLADISDALPAPSVQQLVTAALDEWQSW